MDWAKLPIGHINYSRHCFYYGCFSAICIISSYKRCSRAYFCAGKQFRDFAGKWGMKLKTLPCALLTPQETLVFVAISFIIALQ